VDGEYTIDGQLSEVVKFGVEKQPVYQILPSVSPSAVTERSAL
jgi:hypothetical protein